MTEPVLLLHPDDTVGVALRPLAPGDAVRGVRVRGPVPAGHKVALRDVAPGAAVTKYGQFIGSATTRIVAGEHVHTHNLGYEEGPRNAVTAPAAPPTTPTESLAYQGFRRADGRVGTRSYIGILTSVNCSATVAKLIAEACRGMPDDGVDGVVALTHGTGCGLADDGDGLAILRRTLAGYARHPNIGGLLVLGLGCEVNQLDGIDLPDDRPVVPLTIQELGGTAATVRAGVAAVAAMRAEVAAARRTDVPVSELVLGLQCGGSDGYSGLTANPALGVAADLLVAHGGTAILGETPEIYGAEHLLAARATDDGVVRRLMTRVDWWRGYVDRHGGSLDHNPSPGNRAGGITTILEKSLGAVAKGGASPLTAVYEYAEPVTARGLVFMDTPGYDPVSATGMVAGGATVLAFTTGRGSVFGCRPTPSIKLSTNSELYRRMPDDIDLDCGGIADGSAGLADLGRRVFDLVLDVASGRRTRSEDLGFGAEEFVPWQLGAVM